MGCCSSDASSEKKTNQRKSASNVNPTVDEPESARTKTEFATLQDVHVEDYEWGELLGKGAFGSVWRVVRQSDCKEMSCKIIDTASFSKALIGLTMQEIDTLMRLSDGHKGVLKFYDVTKNGSQLQLFMEMCYGGNLAEAMDERIQSMEDIRAISMQLFDVLYFLHEKKIMHMDLKPENIMFSKTKGTDIRVLDFGLCARRRTGASAKGGRGTLNYMAPEVIIGHPFTEQADIWSAGITIYRLMTGEKPWSVSRKTSNEATLQRKFRLSKLRWPDYASEESKQVILATLAYYPHKRPTAEELLKYQWFQKEETSKLDQAHLQRLKIFANRGKLQKALTPLMMKQAQCEDENIIAYARHIHEQTGGELNEFDFDDFVKLIDKIQEEDGKSTKVKSEKSVVGAALTKYDDLEVMFDAIDIDHSGTISLAEFMSWFWYDYTIKQDDRLWQFIKTLDTHGDGLIRYNDVEAKIKEMHEGTDFEEYLQAFQKVMSPGDMYSIEYFAHLFRHDVNVRGQSSVGPQSLESKVMFDLDDADTLLSFGLGHR